MSDSDIQQLLGIAEKKFTIRNRIIMQLTFLMEDVEL
jgi:hypothetical protein